MADNTNPLANIDKYIVGANPAQSTSNNAATTNPLANLDKYTNIEQKKPTENVGWGTTALDYIKDTGKAVVRGGASLLDMMSHAFNQTTDLTGRPLPLPGTVFPPGAKRERSSTYDIAEKAMPYEHPIYGKTVEGAVSGTPFGGVPGATIGAIASGGTEAMNIYNPNHPIANTLIPLGVGMVAGPAIARQASRLAKVSSEGLRATSRPELVQAKRDLGVSAGTAASASDDPFWFKMQRGLRDRALFPGSSNIERNIETEQHQLSTAVQNQANKLFPVQTQQQLGQGIQSSIEDGVDIVKRIFGRQEQHLDTLINPKTTNVNMIPYVDRAINEIASSSGAHIPLIGGKVQSGDRIIDRLIDNILQSTKANGSNSLSLEAIREHKQIVGDHLKQSLLNGDANKRQLSQIYGILADAQGEAYGVVKGINPAGKATYTATTPQAQQYQALKAAEAEMYSMIEEFAEPLIRRGITSEKMADLITNQMKLGGTKLSELIKIMEQASPSIRNQLASSILFNIGKNNKGDFNPDRFFTRWQQIAPEAKQALFGQGPNQDIPKIYDQLALVATNQARGAKAVNTSGTHGAAEIYHELRNWGALLGGAAGLGWGASDMLGASAQDQVSKDSETSALVKGAGGAGVGALIASIGGPLVLGKMMTNPAFLRWIATPTVSNIPAHAKALSGIAAEYPEIGPAVTSFQQYLTNKGFAKGGYASPYNTANDNNTLLDRLLGGVTQGLPSMNPMEDPNKGLNPLAPALRPANQNSKIRGFAQGGPVNFAEYPGTATEQTSMLDMLMGGRGLPGGGRGGSGSFYRAKTSDIARPNETTTNLKDEIISPAIKNGYTTDAFHGNRRNANIKEFRDPMFNNQEFSEIDAHKGIFFSKKPEMANDFAMGGVKPHEFQSRGGLEKERGVVYPVKLKMDNPLEIKDIPYDPKEYSKFIDLAKNKGHDSVIFRNTRDDFNGAGSIHDDVYVIFSPNQAKSKFATEFNPDSPLLSKKEGGYVGYAQGGAVDRASQATQMLQQALGLSPHQASGAVKYMNINESRLDPNIVNPTSGAYGVAQWLGPRKQALFSKYGPKPAFDQQINHIIDELKGPENKTFKALVNAKNEKEAYDIWGSMFERPGQVALAKAGVNYRPGNMPVSTVSMANSSLLDQIMTEPTGTSAIDDDLEEQPNQRGMELAQEHVNNAASMGADPLVQAVIKTIWSSADV